MSSGSSGRYQSRLFNFVHQQSRRVTQQWEHTFRHLQVATKWGVEVLLYPVYLLFQSSESSGKTLQTKEPQPRLKLQPNDTDFQPEIPNVDNPIQHVLEAVNYLSSNEAVSTPAKTVESFKTLAFLKVLRLKFADKKSTNNANLIQLSNINDHQSESLNPLQLENALNQHLSGVRGIATSLMDRSLVLVTAGNEILDILTPQQQAILEDRIINEVANYWKCWRLIISKKETELLPQIDRLLAKLTDGNTDKNSVLAERIPKDLLNTDKLLAFLDIALAKFESNTLVPVQERSQEIVKVAQTQLNIFLYGKEQLAARGEITANTDGLETHTLDLQALIEAALNYFFGVGNRETLESTTSNERVQGKLLSSRFQKSLSKNSQLENQDLTDDPWLTWNDLFGDTETIAQKPVIPSGRTNPALASSLSAGHFPQNHLTVKQPKVGSGLARRSQKTSGKVVSTKQSRTSISQSKSESQKGEILHQEFHQSSQVEAQPDWIETKATSIGYEKHPLEQLLEWVDYAMLWLEERFVKIFQSLRQLWQGK
ncbi:hypothetical protein NIES4072_58020 [Nostoc commune NIES-4072]|uniref:Uncharacterized protein n=1 Tax=Nostoc commune NIES-4072 TaxID=2005467 RepID=A0A2R5FTL2_NOSCO|nr:hypothetical protein [Nostoc commune]BBD66920.1 hypothetical protein NIES4070_32910 [Nostoc commune HK-02]GBG22096.1 hypothetical protein NIES4072_58020 [Nostoc commune NIES-4072]